VDIPAPFMERNPALRLDPTNESARRLAATASTTEKAVALPASYLERIRAMRPDLVPHALRLNSEGLVNDVVIVDETWVFRFTKSDWGRAALKAELIALNTLRGRLPLAIPEPIVVAEDAVHYRLLPGAPLTRWRWLGLDPPAQSRVTEQLGGFLRALHSSSEDADLPCVPPERKREQWRERRARIEATVYPHLMSHQRDWAGRLFDDALSDPATLDYSPALVHDDLAPYHILFDEDARRLSAVIDFGTVHYDDPAADLGCLLQHYGEAFVTRLIATYPEATELLSRARFYALAIELDWTVLGIERNEAFWFTAHIGNARDVRFPILP
jgi:aminoglycoside 2''-phosphotransferase